MIQIYKKSQTEEIMGVMIIIIILVGGVFFFYVRDIFNSKPESSQKEYISTQYANDVIDVIIRTTSANCKGLSFKDLLQDCEKGMDSPNTKIPEFNCDAGNNLLKCTYAKEEISFILGKHLKDKEGIDYYFTVYNGDINNAEEALKWSEGSPPEEQLFKIGSLGTTNNPSPCPASKRSKTYQLPTTGGSGQNMFIKLDICI